MDESVLVDSEVNLESQTSRNKLDVPATCSVKDLKCHGAIMCGATWSNHQLFLVVWFSRKKLLDSYVLRQHLQKV